ncbi:DUF1194 domain-containing protein [Stappia stellulata]|uniref:DUF1194 domain-containing protein n=1 Tax=Stappia stellulata TaxID=71235 RepID=UPI00040AD5AD|nr:DUF1194 domain-containing protein [Stappia stellulata]
MRTLGQIGPVLRAFFLSAIVSAAIVPSARAEVAVDVALVLAVDVSRSMSHEEMRIQRRGYADAISSPQVLRAISQGPHGRIAVTLFEWAADYHAREIVAWTVIETRADAQAIAATLLSQHSRGERRTSISGGIDHAVRLLEAVPFLADRRVIDVSGDGPNNQGLPVTMARDAAVRKGITINGLPLMTEGGYGSQFNIPDLDEYYRRCVIGGPGAFMIPVNDWDQFAEAVRRKLVLEIGALEPMPTATERARVMPAQFDFAPPYDCLIGEKIWRQRGW